MGRLLERGEQARGRFMDVADRVTGRPRHAIPERFDAEQQAAAEKFVTFIDEYPLEAVGVGLKTIEALRAEH